eukprot:CAMPEP_0204573914 /NCGR_PEP_ID=MMETSP0661-20131031/40299_1 /ASSEMBLY_ACC=CAM_ASM_000606 /TAXON_ID=109239 /ORGANISM="Alexandrium margalefi, Strain AMGDE01CS-322" /LENGTH=573 /DNA_ID=CAMNT_0051582397 /DNA_START=57 /DNA_END=1773 /DNA_ORIENTATION=+
MVRKPLRCLTLCTVLCALLHPGEASAGDAFVNDERCMLEDDVALHQHMIRVRSHGEEAGEALPLTRPSRSMAAKVKPLIRGIADGIIQRASAKLKLPTIPAVFRWELAGKITKWGTELYQRPKSSAALDLLDDIINLAADVLGSSSIATMADAEFYARIRNASRLHQIARRFVDNVGAPPAVITLVDSTAESALSGRTLDLNATAQTIVDIANQTTGPALADLFAYMKTVREGKVPFDAVRVLELYVPLLAQFGAPPAAAAYLRRSAEMASQHAVPDATSENVRAVRMLSQASRELGMPSAISEAADYIADVTGDAPHSHTFERPEAAAQVFAHLNALQVKINDQLGGPASLSTLIHRFGAPLRNESAPDAAETLGLVAKASRQMHFPSAVSELFEYLGPLAAKGGKPDPDRVRELLILLGQQVGVPEAFSKFGKDVDALLKKSGSSPDPAKLTKLVTQLLRKLGMPAFADIFGKVGGPLMTKGKAPDALAMAALTPSLINVMPDFATAQGLARDVRTKLLSPLLPVYERAVEKLTGNMPESAMKSAFKQVLSLASADVRASLRVLADDGLWR